MLLLSHIRSNQNYEKSDIKTTVWYKGEHNVEWFQLLEFYEVQRLHMHTATFPIHSQMNQAVCHFTYLFQLDPQSMTI